MQSIVLSYALRLANMHCFYSVMFFFCVLCPAFVDRMVHSVHLNNLALLSVVCDSKRDDKP